MRDLPSEVKSRPLTALSIPGSHDSFTYGLDKSLPVGPDESEILRKLSKIFGLGPLVRSIVYRWSTTQRVEVRGQLEAGIRYFDFRLSKVRGESDLRIIHALYGPKVKPILEEIERFLASHEDEVVFLDFQHFYGVSRDDLEDLRAFIEVTFGSKLLPPTNPCQIQSLTLQSMVGRGHQVICIFDGAFFPRSVMPNPWANTTNPRILQDFLCKGLRTRDQSLFFVTQAILTENVGSILKHPFSSLEKELAGKCDFLLCHDWLREMALEGLRVNVVIADFVEKDRFCDVVIKENYQSVSPEKAF